MLLIDFDSAARAITGSKEILQTRGDTVKCCGAGALSFCWGRFAKILLVDFDSCQSNSGRKEVQPTRGETVKHCEAGFFFGA